LHYAKSLFTGFRAGCFSFFLAVGSVPLAVSRTVPVFPVWNGLFLGLGAASGGLFLLPGRFFHPVLPLPVGRSPHHSFVAGAYATAGGPDSYGVPDRVAGRVPGRVSGSAHVNPLLYPLTFLPSAFVWLLLCNENYMISEVVALLLALWAVNLYQRAGERKSRIAMFYVLQPVLFSWSEEPR